MSGEVGQACWFCGGQLVWDNDYNYDEVFGDGALHRVRGERVVHTA